MRESVGVSVFVCGAREAESGPLTPGGLRDGQPILPTLRASRSPVARTRVAQVTRFPLVAHATALAHAHATRDPLASV